MYYNDNSFKDFNNILLSMLFSYRNIKEIEEQIKFRQQVINKHIKNIKKLFENKDHIKTEFNNLYKQLLTERLPYNIFYNLIKKTYEDKIHRNKQLLKNSYIDYNKNKQLLNTYMSDVNKYNNEFFVILSENEIVYNGGLHFQEIVNNVNGKKYIKYIKKYDEFRAKKLKIGFFKNDFNHVYSTKYIYEEHITFNSIYNFLDFYEKVNLELMEIRNIFNIIMGT